MNNFKQQSKRIGEHNFKVAPFTALETVRIKTYLIKLLAPSFGRIMSGLDLKKGANIFDADIDGLKMSEALETLFDKLSEDDLVALIQRLFRRVTVETKIDGKTKIFVFNPWNESIFDIVFQGHILDIYKVMFFVLEVNLPDFFGKMEGIGDLFKTLLSPKEEEVPNDDSRELEK